MNSFGRFGLLPVELIEKIIGFLLVEDGVAPVIGHNAAATDVFRWYKNKIFDLVPIYSLKKLRLTCRYLNQICIPILFYELNLLTYRQVKFFPIINELILIPYAKYIGVLRLAIGRRFPAASILTRCYNLRSLSLYITHGIVDYTSLIAPIRRLLQSPERSYPLGSSQSNNNDQPGRGGKLTSLGLYYQDSMNGSIEPVEMERYWTARSSSNVPAALLSSILDTDLPSKSQNTPDDDKNNGEIHSSEGFEDRFGDNRLDSNRLDSFLPIQTLDFVSGPISLETLQSLQTRLGKLKSLTIQHALYRRLGLVAGVRKSIWDPIAIKPTPCSFRPSLTRLSLRDCGGVEAVQVPGLVQFFPALTHLSILACGNLGTLRVERPRGWSSSGSSILGMNRTLNMIRIEHMDEEEIMSMGVIPTRTLCIISRQLIKVLARDPEIFPRVKVLRTFAGTKQDPVYTDEETREEGGASGGDDGEEQRIEAKEGWKKIKELTLDDLCQARDIELRRDLENYIGCGRADCIYV